MLITEEVELNGRKFRHNYSDAGMYILRNDGVKYIEAYDVLESQWTYTETKDKVNEPDISD